MGLNMTDSILQHKYKALKSTYLILAAQNAELNMQLEDLKTAYDKLSTEHDNLKTLYDSASAK